MWNLVHIASQGAWYSFIVGCFGFHSHSHLTSGWSDHGDTSMTGCEPTLIRKESGAQFSVGDAGDVWFPPFPLNNSYRDQLDVIKSLQMRDDDIILTGFPKSVAKTVRVLRYKIDLDDSDHHFNLHHTLMEKACWSWHARQACFIVVRETFIASVGL
ncbi:hypothetical protein RRG08_050545 [Elysia crispata]|uniref:Uncharacterized protein n=1 Tax=Elysia crispata TaxID=231223 RepID=A0AAE0Z014_9GAST|nr:hypothetical protein RRG08_050545 [Elysia crispata]